MKKKRSFKKPISLRISFRRKRKNKKFMNQTKIKQLTNLKIIQKQDKNLNDYYIIFNQNGTNEAYFCWEKAIKQGWEEFHKNWPNIKEIALEYEITEKGNKVVGILSHDQTVDFFV